MVVAVILPVLLLAGATPPGAAQAGEVFDEATVQFARQVDARTLSLLAVQYEGRTAILDTLAREELGPMVGTERIDGVEPAVAYLEFYFNAGRYLSRPIIQVREKQMRAYLADFMAGRAREEFLRTRRLAPVSLAEDSVLSALLAGGRASLSDEVFARQVCLEVNLRVLGVPVVEIPSEWGGVGSLREALEGLSKRPELRVPSDRLVTRYWSFLAIDGPRFIPTGGQWISLAEARQVPGRLASYLAAQGRCALSLGESPLWRGLQRAHLAVMHAWLNPEVNPEVLSAWRKLNDLRKAWRARDAGGVNRVARELLESLPACASPGVYPSMTVRQLERLYNRLYKTTIVWIGCAVAMVFLILAAGSGRRWARWAGLGVFGLSTGAMLAGFIGRWIISGRQWYLPPIMNQFEAVVGSALLAALLALGLELAWKRNYFALAASFYATAALLCGFFLPEQMGAGVSARPGILNSPVMAVHVAVIIIGHAMAGMTFFISLAYLVVMASQAIRGAPAPARIEDGRASPPALTVIDRCNLIVAQLACWTLALGTILGSYWGDMAWGRWWGWDPKETWALITVIIYVAVLHLRLAIPARHRGWATAVGCIVGAAAMVFNWIFVSYVIPGKHSYA
jgi:ABC-type transport system involved in cytochrome c biogenesis permease subunit